MTNFLDPGESLVTGESLVSDNGLYTLVMQGDGNIVLYQEGFGALWGSGLRNGDTLVMQPDGNLVEYVSTEARPTWSTDTAGRGDNPRLIVQDDGNLVVYAGGKPVWATGTRFHWPVALGAGSVLQSGEAIESSNRRQLFAMQTDGNLVAYRDGKAEWSLLNENVKLKAGSVLAVQVDGNLVVYGPGGNALWSTNTAGGGADLLAAQDDGNVVLYNHGTPRWALDTLIALENPPAPTKAGYVKGDWHPDAIQRPISGHTNGAFNVSQRKVLVLHVNESNGNLFNFFNNGANEVSSHFEVYKNGTFEQYLPISLTSWCQANGNNVGISMETEGFTTEPLTDAALTACAKIFAWCIVNGVPAQLTDVPAASPGGLGWHGMGAAVGWGHALCPGTIRNTQRSEILRRAVAML